MAAGIAQSAQTAISSIWNRKKDDIAQLDRHRFFMFYACIKSISENPHANFDEEARTAIRAINDKMQSAGPELEAEGTSAYYPRNMEGAENMILQLVLKYMALPQEFHNPYSTLDRDKFLGLLEGPRCQGETGTQIRNFAKVVLGAMNLGKEGNFVPKILITGPSGTGKTSIVSEMASAMGTYLIRFNFRQVKKDIDDHAPMFGYRPFEGHINNHMPNFDTPLLDAYRMSGVKNPWILIDEYPARSPLTASLKDLLDQEHSKLDHSVIFIISNDELADFDPALVERCISVQFGRVSESAKAAVYDGALYSKGMRKRLIPLHVTLANKLRCLDYNELTWGQVRDEIPPINRELNDAQIKRQEDARELAKLVILKHKAYVLRKDNRDGVRTAWLAAEYIKSLVIGNYFIDENLSLPNDELARGEFAEEYLREDILATIENLSETGAMKLERLAERPSGPKNDDSSSDSDSDSNSSWS